MSYTCSVKINGFSYDIDNHKNIRGRNIKFKNKSTITKNKVWFQNHWKRYRKPLSNANYSSYVSHKAKQTRQVEIKEKYKTNDKYKLKHIIYYTKLSLFLQKTGCLIL